MTIKQGICLVLLVFIFVSLSILGYTTQKKKIVERSSFSFKKVIVIEVVDVLIVQCRRCSRCHRRLSHPNGGSISYSSEGIPIA